MAPESVEAFITDAMHVLQSLQSAITAFDVPTRPGLYAVWANERTRTSLCLVGGDSKRPLYIGKAERNLRAREFNTHFNAVAGSVPRTGSSTVRRSFAALLRPSMGFRAIPRNPAKPGYFSNYALIPEDEASLTAWMHEELRLSVWPKPDEMTVPLRLVEGAIIER